MIKGTTKSGFNFAIPKDNFDDMELMDALAEMAENDPMAVSRVVRLMLGEDLRKQLYEHLRAKEGRVRATSVFAAIEDIFGAYNQQGKNS